MARWVKIRRYLTMEAALVERALLESAGLLVWSPDDLSYGTLTHLEGAALEGYRLFVIESDAEEARLLLAQRDEAQTSHPCPECGGKTRRLKNISATIMLSVFFGMFGGPVPAPIRRRSRICSIDRTRFNPDVAAAVTEDELEPQVANATLGQQLRRFLAWGRSIGYDRDDSTDRSDRS